MKKRQPILIPLACLAAVLLFDLFSTPGFFAITVRDGRLYGSLIDVLNRAAPVMILSAGMTLVIATGGVDLSVGAVMAIAGAVAASLIARPDGCALNWMHVSGLAPIVGVALFVALVCGLFSGFLVSYLKFQSIVATLLLMVAGRGIAQLITQGQIVTFTDPVFAQIGTGAWLGLPIPIWLSALVFAGFGLFSRKTNYGLFLESTGGNETASEIAGVRTRQIKLIAFALSGLCAGIAGLIATADIKAADANNAGLYLELDAILAVAVGGTSLSGGRFSLVGSIVGAVLMQSITTTIFARGVSPEVSLIVKALIIVGVCVLQSPTFRDRPRKVAVA